MSATIRKFKFNVTRDGRSIIFFNAKNLLKFFVKKLETPQFELSYPNSLYFVFSHFEKSNQNVSNNCKNFSSTGPIFVYSHNHICDYISREYSRLESNYETHKVVSVTIIKRI